MKKHTIIEESSPPLKKLTDSNGNAIRDSNNHTISTSGKRNERREILIRKGK